jgi:tetratricopeptide (TPR) repeat protein
MNNFFQYGFLPVVVLSLLLAGCAKDDGAKDFESANIAVKEGRLEDAAEMFQSAAAKNPTNFTARLSLALVNLSLGEIDKADAAISSALALDPDSAEAFLVEGQIAYERKEYPRSLSNFAAISSEPSLPKNLRANALASRGVVNYVMSSFEPSRVDVLKAIALDPRNAAAWYQLGVLSRDSRYFEASLIQFNMASRCLPKGDSRIDRIEKKILPDLRKRMESDAKALIGKVSKTPLEDANKIASSAKKASDVDKAISAYRVAMSAKPFSQKVYNDAVAFAKSKGRWAIVVEFLQRSIMHQPGDKRTVIAMIEVLPKVGRRKEVAMWKEYLSTL